jgi:hypothetical protein
VTYQLDVDPTPDGTRLGISTHAGPASFLADADRRGVWPTLAARARLPVQERRTGFTQVQKSQVLIAALAAGCRRARDSEFDLVPDPLAATVLGLPRWPHSRPLPPADATNSTLTRPPQNVHPSRREADCDWCAGRELTTCPTIGVPERRRGR